MPIWLSKLEPETKVHFPPVYSHRSLRNPRVPAPSLPNPPKSQKFPAASVQGTAFVRAPGYGLGLGGGFPFWATRKVFPPLCQLHTPALAVKSGLKALALNSQRSFR